MFSNLSTSTSKVGKHRQANTKNYIQSTKEDVLQAIDLFFDVIWIKTDDLSATARKFYEDLKEYLEKKDKDEPENVTFTQREIRLGMLKSKTQVHRLIKKLLNLEYIKVKKGNKNKGIQYQISFWDSYQLERNYLKETLLSQF